MQFFDSVTLSNLEEIKKRYQHLCKMLSYEEVITDKLLCLNYQKQKFAIEPVAESYLDFLSQKNQAEQIVKTIKDLFGQEKELFEQELAELNQKLNITAKKTIELLQNLNATNQSILVQIVSGQNLFMQQFAEDIKLGYVQFCKTNGIKCFASKFKNNINLNIEGLNVKQIFGTESGLHIAVKDCQQVECKVFVLDDLNHQPTFKKQDITISVCRSSGAGGQHVNTTDSAIKVRHNPTGITAVCQDQRSQFQNKQKAIENLKRKVQDFYEQNALQYFEKQKKEQSKLKHIAKKYDYNVKTITISDKTTLALDDFLLGKQL